MTATWLVPCQPWHDFALAKSPCFAILWEDIPSGVESSAGWDAKVEGLLPLLSGRSRNTTSSAALAEVQPLIRRAPPKPEQPVKELAFDASFRPS